MGLVVGILQRFKGDCGHFATPQDFVVLFLSLCMIRVPAHSRILRNAQFQALPCTLVWPTWFIDITISARSGLTSMGKMGLLLLT